MTCGWQNCSDTIFRLKELRRKVFMKSKIGAVVIAVVALPAMIIFGGFTILLWNP